MEIDFFGCGVDSLTAVAPLHLFTDLPSDLTAKIITFNSETDEILEETYGAPVYKEIHGIKHRIQVVKLFGKKDYVKITFNAKQLGRDLLLPNKTLASINSATFPKVFDNVSQVLGFRCDYHKYLQEAKVWDVDLKADFRQPPQIYQNFILSFCAVSGFRHFRSNDVLKSVTGGQFVNRKDASISKPFVKIYNKLSELLGRSTEFHQTFVPRFYERDYQRLEGTIKNSTHFEYLVKNDVLPPIFAKGITFEKIFSLTPFQIQNVILFLLRSHNSGKSFNPPVGTGGSKDLTTNQYIIARLVTELMISGGLQYHEVITSIADKPDLSPNTRKTTLARYKKAYRYRVLDYANTLSYVLIHPTRKSFYIVRKN